MSSEIFINITKEKKEMTNVQLENEIDCKNIDHFTNNTSECRICLSDHTSIQLFLMTGQNREVNVEIRISPNHKCPHCNDVTHFECTLRMYRAQQHIQCLRCRQNIIT